MRRKGPDWFERFLVGALIVVVGLLTVATLWPMLT